MNWIDITQKHPTKLRRQGFHLQRTLDKQKRGGTGGEVFTYLVYKLIEIKKHQPEAYAVIKEETE